MDAEIGEVGRHGGEAGLLEQFAHRRRGEALARLGLTLGDVPARRAGGVAEEDLRAVADDDAAAGAPHRS